MPEVFVVLAGLLLGGCEVCACGLACRVGAGAVLAAGVERHFSQGAAAGCGRLRHGAAGRRLRGGRRSGWRVCCGRKDRRGRKVRYGVGQGADSLGVVEMGGIVRLCIRKNKPV